MSPDEIGRRAEAWSERRTSRAQLAHAERLVTWIEFSVGTAVNGAANQQLPAPPQLYSIAYQVRDVIVAMESDTAATMSELRVDGGATANNYLMQFQADIVGKPVRRAKIAETTAMGAAMLAGLAVGVWNSPRDLNATINGADLFRPNMQSAERDKLLIRWHDAVSRTLAKQSN